MSCRHGSRPLSPYGLGHSSPAHPWQHRVNRGVVAGFVAGYDGGGDSGTGDRNAGYVVRWYLPWARAANDLTGVNVKGAVGTQDFSEAARAGIP